MTQRTSLPAIAGSDAKKVERVQALADALAAHCKKELVSFHTPGHKGRDVAGAAPKADWRVYDLTELPGLDELAAPQGVLFGLEQKAARIWQARESYISVNGASAALCAAILAVAGRSKSILLPRNIHRSAINALVIAGLEPLWFEPKWDSSWGLWGEVRPEIVEDFIRSCSEPPAAVVITSPTYAGKLSPIAEIAKICRQYKVLLIVDEAHGAHLSCAEQRHKSAVLQGADVVVHSMHKTLSAPTQTGLLQVGRGCELPASSFQSAINLLQSSSPSYHLMFGIEQALDEIEAAQGASVSNAVRLAQALRQGLLQITGLELYGANNGLLSPLNVLEEDALHVLFRLPGMDGEKLYGELSAKGIFAETVLGNGVLLMLGTGSQAGDCEQLLVALKEIIAEAEISKFNQVMVDKPNFGEQVLTPREAFFLPVGEVELKVAAGRIAGDWLAPCPPGEPVLVPGQRILGDVCASSRLTKKFKVVMDS